MHYNKNEVIVENHKIKQRMDKYTECFFNLFNI